LSLFLIEGLGFEPIYIGIYTVSYALAGIIVSQKFGAMADRGVDSKNLFIIALCGMAMTALSYAFLTEFWQILLAGTVFMGFARASVPMILTMIRHFADSSGLNATKVNAQLRSSVSLIWIVGPPLAFFSVDQFGFQINFLIAAGLTMVVAFYAWKKLPKADVALSNKKAKTITVNTLPKTVIYLGITLFFGNLANANYITAMPLYLTSELNMPLSYPGLLLGLTAACEVPIMLMAAKWANRIGGVRLLMLSFVMAMIFYVLCQWMTSIVSFLLIQILNGLFFGVFVGIGISLLQNEAPNSIGKATAFYSNMMALGSMGGASMMAVVSQYFGYKEALLLSLVAIVIAFIMLLFYDFSGKKIARLSDTQNI
jgi:SET family sugar efflux transporter-like MFS transporter